MRSFNSKYETEYHFFKTHVAMKIIKADDKYAFLYEGPIGGEQTSADKWVFKDGSENKKSMCSMTACVTPYIYFVDPDAKDTQLWYVGTDKLTAGVGGDSYIHSAGMVVVSFGRSGSYPNDTRKLTGTEAICVFGFHNKAEHKVIDEFITARLAKPYVSGETSIKRQSQFNLQANPQEFQINIDKGINGNVIHIDTELNSEYHVELFNVQGMLLQSWKASGSTQSNLLNNPANKFLILKVKTNTNVYQQNLVLVN
jgi:hypothetical protein